MDLLKHFSHYLSLISVLVFGLMGFLLFPYDQQLQSSVAYGLGASFIAWGIVHHHLHNDLKPWIVLEYVATAALGVVILQSMIWS